VNSEDLRQLDRRSVVLGGMAGGAALLAGCTSSRPPAVKVDHPSSVTTSTRAGGLESPGTVPALPASRVWPIRPSEVEPEIKEAAIRLLETLAQWPEGDAGRKAASRRLRDLPTARGHGDRLLNQAGPLLGAYSEASVRVVATQYGGLLETSASVLVALRQWTRRPDGSVRTGGSTVDVRVAKMNGQWVVTELHVSRPGPAARPEPVLVRRIIEHPRIHLPPASRADVLAGSLCPRGMRALLLLARRYDVGVSVVHSGHPYYVFGTDRISDHTRKRAFDVWAINDHPIVAPRTSPALVDGFMRSAVAAGAYNVGGPRLLSGSEFFSDPTHHDHTHIAFDQWA
jgi:hypothetical protein